MPKPLVYNGPVRVAAGARRAEGGNTALTCLFVLQPSALFGLQGASGLCVVLIHIWFKQLTPCQYKWLPNTYLEEYCPNTAFMMLTLSNKIWIVLLFWKTFCCHTGVETCPRSDCTCSWIKYTWRAHEPSTPGFFRCCWPGFIFIKKERHSAECLSPIARQLSDSAPESASHLGIFQRGFHYKMETIILIHESKTSVHELHYEKTLD